jgi:molybdopterin-guanine dinucleotide biosynthesis protein B
MLAQLDPSVDWVLVEGFKHGELPKIEVWRRQQDRLDRANLEPLFAHDPRVLAVATDAAHDLQTPVQPVLDLNQPQLVLQWLLAHSDSLQYKN